MHCGRSLVFKLSILFVFSFLMLRLYSIVHCAVYVARGSGKTHKNRCHVEFSYLATKTNVKVNKIKKKNGKWKQKQKRKLKWSCKWIKIKVTLSHCVINNCGMECDAALSLERIEKLNESARFLQNTRVALWTRERI